MLRKNYRAERRDMEKLLSTLLFSTFLLSSSGAVAADKIVVVPLGGNSPAADTNLVPGKIRKGVKVLRVTGNLGIAWGCRNDMDGNGVWNGSDCYDDCLSAGKTHDGCSSLCNAMSIGLLDISSGPTDFCNGDGGQ